MMMQQTRREQAQKYRQRRRRKKIWRNVLSVMACIVVFCTTYALILPAITMEKEAFCGIEAHTHEGECYAQVPVLVCDPTGGTEMPVIHTHDALCYAEDTLVCTLPELAGHVHGDGCYTLVTVDAHTHSEGCYAPERGTLLCEVLEEKGHTHNESCYVPGENLLCTEAEREGHVHGDGCYAISSELNCTTAETQGHAHSDACYVETAQLGCGTEETSGHSHGDGCYNEADEKICTEEEIPAHTHGDACYVSDRSLNCDIPEVPAHAHGPECYTEHKTLTCKTPEDPGHTHSGSCYEQVLGCGLEEKEGHAHEDACYEMVSTLACGLEEREEAVTETVLTCGLTQIAPHIHNEGCVDCSIVNAAVHQHAEACIDQNPETPENLICELEEHEHTLPCFSDPNADVETREQWDAMIAKLELTGDWAEDVLTIAKSQLGYNESTKNYTVLEDGETMKGYTRYGAWYGVPYGDWCAMYASFCLDYAGVEGIPLDSNCNHWIGQLKERNMYRESGEYEPLPGDLIFFDTHHDGTSNHVGLVVEVDGDTVKTIEGNTGDTVAYRTYKLDDGDIMGYGLLPVKLTAEEQAAVNAVIALIDAMPSADEIDAKLEEFYEAEDEDGEIAYLEAVYQQVYDTYDAYAALEERLQEYVTNRDKLLELEYIWSARTLEDTNIQIAKTIAFDTSILTSQYQFVLYTQSGDDYYALDGSGNAVQVYIDTDTGAVMAAVSDPNSLYWTFKKNNNNYSIQNVGTKNYIRLNNNNVVGKDSQNLKYTQNQDGTFTVQRDDNNRLGFDGSNQTFSIVKSNAVNFRLAKAPGMVTVWFDGTCGQIENYEGSELASQQLSEESATLPTTWKQPNEYEYVLRGWYDIVNGVYYKAGATVEGLQPNTIFYADWRAKTYDVGQDNDQVSDTVSTDHFITTRMYDYGILFNMYSEVPTITWNNNGEPSVEWAIVEKDDPAVHQKTDANGNPTGEKDTSMGFIFRDWDEEAIYISQPTNWDQAPVAHYNNYHPRDAAKINGSTPKDGTTRGIADSDERILNRLFTTSGGVLGQEYLGTADHLFHYGTDPANEDTYGYYYYDSEYNAASYNQSEKRFYVYKYLEQTTTAYNDSDPKDADFLPFNSPYANNYGKTPGAGLFGNGKTGYVYDSHADAESKSRYSDVASNLWFGMRTDIKFFLPHDPGTDIQEGENHNHGNQDMNNRDMTFEFSGDDDVWIYVDGQLVLDIGGIHGVMEGSINFATGKVTVSKEYTDKSLYQNNAVKTEEFELSDFLDVEGMGGKQHTLTMYYMERGDSLSNCRIRFNISPRYQMNLQKEDAVNRNKLDGAKFAVYTDRACTQAAELWPTKAAYEAGAQPDNTFTITNGEGSIWGMTAGHVYYIKEIEAPKLDADHDGENDYLVPQGLIQLTLRTDGQTDYEVLEMVTDAEGEDPTPGFSAYGFRVNPVTEEAYMVITNGKNVEKTTSVAVEKVWAGGEEGPAVKVYLKMGDQRIRETTLSDKNNWSYTWTDLPMYSDDLDADGNRIPLEYTVEEGLVPGYTGTVEKLTTYQQTTASWESVSDLEDGKTYLLKNGSGDYLAVMTGGANDTGFRWVEEETAMTDPLAQWDVTKNGDQVTLKNKAGYTLMYYTDTDYFALKDLSNTGNSHKQSFRYDKVDGGVRLYYSNNGNTAYYMDGSGLMDNGKIDNPTQANQGLILYPVTEVFTTTEVPTQIPMFRITNTPASSQSVTSVKVQKKWVMGDGETAADPSLYQDLLVTVRLKADGKDAGLPTRVLEQADHWSYTFTDLPATHADGTQITYSVEEVWSHENWTPSYQITGNAADGYQIQITNRYTQKIQIPVEKHWDGIPEGERPESLRVYLYRVTGTGQTPKPMASLVLSPDNEWKGTFQVDMPASGEKYYIYESTETYYATYSRPEPVLLDGESYNMGLVTFDEDDNPVTVIVTNREKVALPETGGPGDYLYITVGLLLMLTSMAYLLYKHKKRGRAHA